MTVSKRRLHKTSAVLRSRPPCSFLFFYLDGRFTDSPRDPASNSTRLSATVKLPMTASTSGRAQKRRLSTSTLQLFVPSSEKSPRASCSPSARSTIQFGWPLGPWYVSLFMFIHLASVHVVLRLVPLRRATVSYSSPPSSPLRPAVSLPNLFPSIWIPTSYASFWVLSQRRPR